MAKWCFNYDSGEYEYIDRNGFSFSSGEFVFNWDNSEYQNEENDDNFLWQDDDLSFCNFIFIHKKPMHQNDASVFSV